MDETDDFDRFAREVDRSVWQALTPIVGPDRAAHAVNEALVYAWRHWERVASLDNPAGYLYRLAYRAAIRPERGVARAPSLSPFPVPGSYDLPDFEPRLLPALAKLSESQRTVVWLVEACGWGLTDTARMLDLSTSTVRNHLARGMKHLRNELEVRVDV